MDLIHHLATIHLPKNTTASFLDVGILYTRAQSVKLENVALLHEPYALQQTEKTESFLILSRVSVAI